MLSANFGARSKKPYSPTADNVIYPDNFINEVNAFSQYGNTSIGFNILCDHEALMTHLAFNTLTFDNPGESCSMYLYKVGATENDLTCVYSISGITTTDQFYRFYPNCTLESNQLYVVYFTPTYMDCKTEENPTAKIKTMMSGAHVTISQPSYWSQDRPAFSLYLTI